MVVLVSIEVFSQRSLMVGKGGTRRNSKSLGPKPDIYYDLIMLVDFLLERALFH